MKPSSIASTGNKNNKQHKQKQYYNQSEREESKQNCTNETASNNDNPSKSRSVEVGNTDRLEEETPKEVT